VLDRLRGSLRGALSSLGISASRLSPNPTAWTLIGMLLTLPAFASYAERDPTLGGVFLALSGLLDIVDGAVARSTGRTSLRGAFLDSTLDRVAEVIVFLGILVGNYANPALVLVALSLSLMVSYTRAKGDSLGVSMAGVGVGERSERLLVIIVASLFSLVWIGILVVIFLALVTFLERTVKLTRALAAPSSSSSVGILRVRLQLLLGRDAAPSRGVLLLPLLRARTSCAFRTWP
jgi:archaetidylinositol phosphate synthase